MSVNPTAIVLTVWLGATTGAAAPAAPSLDADLRAHKPPLTDQLKGAARRAFARCDESGRRLASELLAAATAPTVDQGVLRQKQAAARDVTRRLRATLLGLAHARAKRQGLLRTDDVYVKDRLLELWALAESPAAGGRVAACATGADGAYAVGAREIETRERALSDANVGVVLLQWHKRPRVEAADGAALETARAAFVDGNVAQAAATLRAMERRREQTARPK